MESCELVEISPLSRGASNLHENLYDLKDIFILSFASTGYPEETFPQHEVLLHKHRFPSIILEEPYRGVPTPEELAERIERESEEDKDIVENTDEFGQDEDGPTEMKDDEEQTQLCEKREETDYSEEEADEEETPHSTGNQKKGETSRRRQITFSSHRHIIHYPKGGAVGCSYEDEEVEEDTPEDDHHDDVEEYKQDGDDNLQKMELEMEEDDPLMEAERLYFSTNPNEQEVDIIDFLLTYNPEDVINSDLSGSGDGPPEVLRRCSQKAKLTRCAHTVQSESEEDLL